MQVPMFANTAQVVAEMMQTVSSRSSLRRLKEKSSQIIVYGSSKTQQCQSPSAISGRLAGIALPGFGTCAFHQLGAMDYLARHKVIEPSSTPMVGSSGGGLIAVLSACSVPSREVVRSAAELSRQHKVYERPLGLMGIWGGIIRAWLEELLPADAAERCRHVGLVVTELPSLKSVTLTGFRSRQELIDRHVIDGNFRYSWLGEEHALLDALDNLAQACQAERQAQQQQHQQHQQQSQWSRTATQECSQQRSPQLDQLPPLSSFSGSSGGTEAQLVDVSGRAYQQGSTSTSHRSATQGPGDSTTAPSTSREGRAMARSGDQDWLHDWAPQAAPLDWGTGLAASSSTISNTRRGYSTTSTARGGLVPAGAPQQGMFLVLDPRLDEQLQLHRNGKWLQVMDESAALDYVDMGYEFAARLHKGGEQGVSMSSASEAA